MKRLILVRHAQPEVDPAIPSNQWPLTAQGRLQCHWLAAWLAPYAPSVIVASTEPKASETARIVGSRLGVAVHSAEGLHEHDRVGIPFLAPDEFRAAIAGLFAHPESLVLGRETAQAALARFDGAVSAVLRTHSGDTVVVVTHGTVLSLFVAAHAGVPAPEYWRQLGMPAFAVLSRPDLTLLDTVSSVDSITQPVPAYRPPRRHRPRSPRACVGR